MNDPLNPARAGNAVARLAQLLYLAILACSVATGCGPQGAQLPQPQQPQPQQPPQQHPQGFQSPQAQQNGLVGQWRAILQGNIVTITIQANGQYIQMAVPQNGGTQFAQGGPYQLVAPNTIIFTVTDWSPKTQIRLAPCGDPSNPACNYPQEQKVPQPPGSRYAYVFNGPNTMTLNNETAQESITFTRVMGP